MLAATPFLTALAAPPPPSPPLSPAHSEFASLEAWLCSVPVRQLPLHGVEAQQYPKGRELQRLLLQAHIQLRGNGDVGPALAVQQAGQPALHTRRRVHTRLLKTIFGPIPITRSGLLPTPDQQHLSSGSRSATSCPLLFLRTPETLRSGRRSP